jgi:hypothetical protein
MAEEIPHAYAYLATIFALAMAGANLLLGRNWYRRTPLDLAGRLKCVALLVGALAWLLMTLADDLNLSPSTETLRDGMLAMTYLAVAVVILAGDRIARGIERIQQGGSAPARRSPPAD